MIRNALTVAALLGQYAYAQNMLRFGCSQLVIERADPLVNPGLTPSPHTHQVVGGNSFNASMDPADLDPSAVSTCTTCTYSEDFSNYWTSSLYFQSPDNGTYQRVPQNANVGISQNGGMTVYYMPYSAKNGKMTAFKPGFRMIAGNPMSKTNNRVSICHRCLGNGEGFAPCDAKDTGELPNKYCPNGIRASIIFPSCWDGKTLDSDDHMSHVAYSNAGGLGSTNCPSTHPVAIPQVMYEIMWDTGRYKNTAWYGTNKQPFVYSFGDKIGYGQHGDYLFGWKGNALQKAMDALSGSGCANANCNVLKIQSASAAESCTKAQQVVEDVGKPGAWIAQLPGNPQMT